MKEFQEKSLKNEIIFDEALQQLIAMFVVIAEVRPENREHLTMLLEAVYGAAFNHGLRDGIDHAMTELSGMIERDVH